MTNDNNQNYVKVDPENSNFSNSLMDITNLDDAIMRVGNQHTYQYRILILFLLIWTFQIYPLTSSSYTLMPPNFICDDGKICTEENGGCKKQQLKQDQPYTMTIEFKLYCENQYMRNLVQSCPAIGSAIGSIFFSFTSDNYGRRQALIISWIFVSVGFFLLYNAQSVSELLAFYIISGFGIFPNLILTFVLLSEQSSTIFRQKSSVVMQMIQSPMEILMAYLAMSLDSWRNFILTGAIPLLVINLGTFFIIESHLFLLSKDKQKSLDSLNKVARINKRPMLDSIEYFNLEEIQQLEEKKDNRIYTYYDLFKHKSLRNNLIGSIIMYIGIQIQYYGTSYAISTMGVNIYLNGMILGVADILGSVLPIFYIQKIKRKKSIVNGGIICGLLVIPFLFIKVDENGNSDFTWQKIVQSLLAGLARMCSMFCYAVIWVYFPELFPTKIKSLAVGLIKFMGLLGIIISPFLIQIGKNINLSPTFILGMIFCIGSIPLIFLSEETLNRPLQNEIEEEVTY